MENSEPSPRTIVITGANKGIGYGIIELLLEHDKASDYNIIMTSRNVLLGEEALKNLKTNTSNNNLFYHQLELTSQESVVNFEKYLRQNFPSGFDILINNAAITEQNVSELNTDREKVEIVMDTNFRALVNLTETLLPLIRAGGLIINVSSSKGIFSLGDDDKRNRFFSSETTLEDLFKLDAEFIQAVKDNRMKEEKWFNGEWNNFYSVSKIFVNAYTCLLDNKFNKEKKELNVVSFTPGWCKTDMGGNEAPFTIRKGADTAVWLILNTPNIYDSNYSGKFFKERSTQNL
jgi:NAD(P)-dependent dehydrogenase (short-subunit alcohol dehydrogenase family)